MNAEAHTAIAGCIARYARGLDDRDFDAVAACFTADAQVTYSGVALAPGRAAIVDYLQGLRSLIASTHIMSQPVIDLHGSGAHVETSGLAFLVADNDGQPVVRTRGLRYVDEFVFQDGRWLIAERVHRCDWMYEGPLAPTTRAR
jgi:ketosteroid isomerase-like protein